MRIHNSCFHGEFRKIISGHTVSNDISTVIHLTDERVEYLFIKSNKTYLYIIKDLQN